MSSFPSTYEEPDPKETFEHCKPQVTLCLVFSSTWDDWWILLNSGANYYKKIARLRIVTEFEEVDNSTLNLLTFCSKPKMTQIPKIVSVLFHFDGDITQLASDVYLSKLTYIFGWCLDHYAQVQLELGIKEFKFGIINTHGNQKIGDLFDLKKCNKEDIIKHDNIWDDILFAKKKYHPAQDWELEFQKIQQSMPQK